MSMIDNSQALTTFRLPPSLLDRLTAARFTTLRDLEGLGPVELSKECPGLSREEALHVLTTIQTDLNDRQDTPSTSTSGSVGGDNVANSEVVTYVSRSHTVLDYGKTALEKLQEAAQLPPIVTFCQTLDEVLGGGVPLGKVTEFCGLPGVGKTQLGTQLAINSFIPFEFGGCGGKAIYVDTEGSFVPRRAMEMVRSVVAHLDSLCSGDLERFPDGKSTLSESQVASNLHYYRVHNYIEQLALIGQLKEIILKINEEAKRAQQASGMSLETVGKPSPAVRCVVIDSVTFHFRATDQFPDPAARSRLLSKMASELTSLATSCQLAVIVMNQMTTKPGAGVVPALGDVWGHQASTRVVLEADPTENKRRAIVVKSSSLPHNSAFYQVTAEGVRDCPD